jgi:hypothetical protein
LPVEPCGSFGEIAAVGYIDEANALLNVAVRMDERTGFSLKTTL